jgi:chemotaxis protein MotB
MTKSIFKVALIVFIALAISSCVTKKKYMELDAAQKKCDQENTQLKEQNINLTSQNNEMQSKIATLQTQNSQLKKDTASLGLSFRDINEKFGKLNKSYDELNEMMLKNSQMSSAELQKLLAELQKSQEDLQIKEDALKKNERDLTARQSDLNNLSTQLADREKRLGELQSILSRKDSIVRALKNKVLEALTGFVDKGLTVVQKNGKVYVSMDEKLLFATGSFEVASNGIEALKKLAKVLESNPDINITIEGHTDNVPYKGGSGPIGDNWDLSVMRATAVVKILLKNSSINPKRLMAAGRSQYWPVDAANSPEARSKNRRTEIILAPKLDELFKILEDN